MSHKWFFLGSCGIFLIAMAVLGIFIASPVRAECGDPPTYSSCITCHEYQGADPVSNKGGWHEIHARNDYCWNCHGGNTKAQDKDLAHEGMTVHPLQDIYTDCHSCHPDYDARAAQFAPTLGVTPGSCATPTPFPVSNTSSEPPSGGITIPTNPVSTTSSSQPFLVIGAMLSILTLFLFGLGWLERHQVKS
jgi:hypothetical protein